tara:strand:- start:1328 stop:1486 length:159 start_codon:yes stop_codon:yes gene_type:complete
MSSDQKYEPSDVDGFFTPNKLYGASYACTFKSGAGVGQGSTGMSDLNEKYNK